MTIKGLAAHKAVSKKELIMTDTALGDGAHTAT